MINVFTTGRHAHRSPLSYPDLWPLFQDDVRHVDDPAAADLHVFAHVIDIQEAPHALVEDWRARRTPVLLISEEPFWDTIWGRDPLSDVIHVDTDFGALPVVQLNHYTSDIFRFERIPYYLLTNHRFANAYAHRFAQNAQLTPHDWHVQLAARPVDLTFMFERRPEGYHDVRWPQGDIIGLCAWRTELAEACTTGTVERFGHSWQHGTKRQALATDWHLDKLMRLENRARLIGAVENTHQPDYLTEKLFDAFACGAVPVYYASPDHRVHDLGLPPGAWINLFDLTPVSAAARLTAPDWPARMADFTTAQTALAELFATPAHWQTERTRLRGAVLGALRAHLV